VNVFPESEAHWVAMPQVVLDSEEAADVADLVTHVLDLQHVIECCERVDDFTDEADPTHLLRRCLWESAVVTYGRCFNSGRSAGRRQGRLKIPAVILDTMSVAEREVHGLLLEERNGHVAHRVNDLVQVKVYGVLNAPPNEPALAGMGQMTAHRVTPDDLPPRVAVLAGRLAAALQADIRLRLEALARELMGDLVGAYARAHPQYELAWEVSPDETPGRP
jgi:hypothetical protein